MINLMKKILEWKLRILARWILMRYKPQIVGITGSVGKTSTKEAVYTVLSSKFRVRKNIKNYNNEFGVPLSIIGVESGYKNPLVWLWIFIKAVGLLVWKSRRYPEILVLEMGADKPGDIKYLTQLAPCRVGVITALGPVHLELFGSMEKLVREKHQIVIHLKKDDTAVLNADDQMVMAVQGKIRSQVLTFGFSETADVRASEVDVSAGPSADPWVDVQIKGLSFKIMYQGSIVPVFFPSVLGEHQVYIALAAAAVGLAFGMNLADVSAALKGYSSPAGRMRLLPGIKNTSIIDDSYNSSPMAVKAALNVLEKLKVSGRKFVVLGDMLELGQYTEAGHKEVGEAVAHVADVLVTVGSRAKIIAQTAISIGLPEEGVFEFGRAEEAGKFVQERIKMGDIILVKGSQGARTEKVVKELMADPEKAAHLLVRQGPEWDRK
ncbi:MAG: Mur ligase family protein [Patescibacteria group bacterium]|jgi:UDP-N-acetylmuramoyl-tripeptide--D-alanyl-D-alanine ligase